MTSQAWPSAPPTLAELVVPPEGLELYDVDEMQEMFDQSPLPQATFPVEPYVLAPAPPSSGGEALELADLALVRGDPLDAAAQYRALLPRLDPSAATYANLRLAQAYILLGDRQRARDILYGIANSRGTLGWSALVELANLRAGDIGGREALVELTSIAGNRVELLADYLIHAVPDDEAAELLIDKAARLNRCDYVQAALTLEPRISAESVPHDCRDGLVQARRTIAGRTFGRQYLELFRQLNPFVERWDALAREVLDGNRGAEPWVAFAEDLSSLRPLATSVHQRETLDGIVRSALAVALALVEGLSGSERKLVVDRIDKLRALHPAP